MVEQKGQHIEPPVLCRALESGAPMMDTARGIHFGTEFQQLLG
jgi:hypothetical protein